jgi:hypothetical protein
MGALVIFYFALCFIIAMIGHDRPLRFWGYFLSSFLFTPFIGLLLLIAAGDNRAHYYRKTSRD